MKGAWEQGVLPIGFSVICGDCRADVAPTYAAPPNEVLLIGLHLMQMKLGVCTNLQAASTPMKSATPADSVTG